MKYIRKSSYDIKEDYVYNLLLDRGILKENEDHSWYFCPTRDNLLDPMLLDFMAEGFEMFEKHLKNGSHIRFIVDSDADGYTSSAIFINYIKENLMERYPDITISYRIPQGKEHGLRTVVDEFRNEKVCDLIILPDSSSGDQEEHKELKELGYDILVLD